MAQYPLAGERLTAGSMAELVRRGEVVGHWRRDTGGFTFASATIADDATPVPWDTSVIDLLGALDTSTPTRIAPPVAGWYLAQGGIGFASSSNGNRRGAAWRLNGTALPAGQARTRADAMASGPTTAEARAKPIPINADTGDYIELVGIQDTGGDLGVAGSPYLRPYLTLTYLGPL